MKTPNTRELFKSQIQPQLKVELSTIKEEDHDTKSHDNSKKVDLEEDPKVNVKGAAPGHPAYKPAPQ